MIGLIDIADVCSLLIENCAFKVIGKFISAWFLFGCILFEEVFSDITCKLFTLHQDFCIVGHIFLGIDSLHELIGELGLH